MALHIIKLCVGIDAIGDLEDWIVERRRRSRSSPDEHVHVTRMMPKRHPELVDGGSLYWVIRGQLCCRQRFVAVRGAIDEGGVSRCHLVLEPQVVPVSPRPVRPFQGWRYLEPDDAPGDLGANAAAIGAMPETMRRELAALGLL